MPDERRDLAVGARKRDAAVDPAREVRDAVLKVVVRDLHHVRLVLDDRHRRALGHLARRVAQAVLGHDRVRVHDEHDLPDPARAPVRRPRPEAPPRGLVHLVDRELQRLLLEVLPFRGVAQRGARLARRRADALPEALVDHALVLAVVVLVLHPVSHLLVHPVRRHDAPPDLVRPALLALEQSREVLLRPE